MDTSNNINQYIVLPIIGLFLFFNNANANERVKEFDDGTLEEKILFSDSKNIYSNNKSDELISASRNYELILDSTEVKSNIDSISLSNRSSTNIVILSKETPEKLKEYGLIKFNNTDQLFLIDGTVIINFKNFPDLNNFASEKNIVLKSSFESIGSASFKVKKLTDLEALLNDLSNNSNVNRVTIDFKDHRLVPE